MEVARPNCRICLCNTDFKISIFSSFCKNINIVDKILVCLKLIVEETDSITTICYKCVENIEKFYEFLTYVKKSQTKFDNSGWNREINETNVNRRRISYVREEVIDADYTFSFLNISKNEDLKERKQSTPFFSFFPPQNVIKQTEEQSLWKRFHPHNDGKINDSKKVKMEKSRRLSRDIFDSQSQDIEEADMKSLDWKLTPEDNILKRVRAKCFGRIGF